jgi:hypothetical protein
MTIPCSAGSALAFGRGSSSNKDPIFAGDACREMGEHHATLRYPEWKQIISPNGEMGSFKKKTTLGIA